MSWLRRALGFPLGLHAALGAPGVIIGLLSLLSFGFGLVVLVGEYHRPIQSGRAALHRIIGGWLHLPDHLGYTLGDYAARWRAASPADRSARLAMVKNALDELGTELAHHDAQFPLIRVVGLDLEAEGQGSLASWRPEFGHSLGDRETLDRIAVSDDDREARPRLALAVRYRVVPEVEEAVSDVETSYHRLLLALLGLSGYSLLSLGYMVLHARALRDRVAREAAAEATLHLADRTCHELGNVAFVVANERRNLSSHIDLLERFVAEDALAHAGAARRAGLDPTVAARFDQALRAEYAARGIDPEFELRGSATIARDVCRQIAVCSDYIALLVRELDGYLKRSSLPVALAPVPIGACVADALALLAPRLEASDARIIRPDAEAEAIPVVADRRLLIHALVNLIKNAVEAAGSSGREPVVTLSLDREGPTAWLSVSDNGPGIPPEARRKIFETGYTTKGAGRGLGLAIVRESIASQGGKLELDSTVGTGTRFRIGLPMAI